MGTWLVLLPPLLVIASVLLTRRMIVSFLLGIFVSALLVTKGDILSSLKLSVDKLWTNSGLGHFRSFSTFINSWNLLIFLFLIMLGILIVLLSQTGAAQAYISVVQKRVKNKKEVEIASLILSLFFFIDDYFSALTVGSVMRPLAQRYNLHPVKLAFLTTAMATPIVILSPISSWVGEIILQLKQVGIGPAGPKTVIDADPYMIFVSAIPFTTYAILLILSTWYIVLRGISFGPMRKYDESHLKEEPLKETKATSLTGFILPLVTLIIGVFFMLLYTGDYTLFGGSNNFLAAVKEASVHQALFTGGLLSLIISSIYFLAQKSLSIKQLPSIAYEGFMLMFPSLIVLICAWSLGSILKNDLQTGNYVASLVVSFINLEFFPVICFLIAALISWMIGSAWATIGLMFPIVIGMLQKLLGLSYNTPLSDVSLIIPIVGATLSGCIIGTQLSVIADNPIMSSASTGADHIEHIKTMAWYIIPIGFSAALAFMVMGLSIPFLGLYGSLCISMITGIVSSLTILELGNYFLGGTDEKHRN